jgi:hypothetical protein
MDNQEVFNKLPEDKQFILLRGQLDILFYSITQRMQILPSISALAAMLLIVATFNTALLPITNCVVFLLSLLLLLVPISLLIYNYDLKKTQHNTKRIIEDYLGQDIEKEMKIPFSDKIIGIFPDTVI